MKAIFKGTIIAESIDTIVIEGNHYFPPNSVNQIYLQASKTTTHCAWKGTANYYNVLIDNETLADAAWYYPEIKQAAKEIKGYIAFWKGVDVVD